MTRLSPWAVAFSCLLISVFWGCRSFTPPVTYYTLGSISAQTTDVDADGQSSIILGILPVELPGYINRLQMVTRTKHHQLKISSLHRWADYPERLVQQVIGENLQALMPHTHVVDAPWPVGLKPDVTVSFRFVELSASSDETLHLRALWTITGQHENSTPRSHRWALSEAMTDSGYDELAAAHSRALEALCRKVAESLQAVIIDQSL